MTSGTVHTGIMNEIRARLGGLTKSQRRVAQFILEQPQEASVLSAARIAELTNVSTSTVIRLARALGRSGFPQLQRELQVEMFDEIAMLRQIRTMTDTLPHDMAGILYQILNNDAELIRRSMISISESSFRYAIDAMAGARRIYCCGFFAAQAAAHILALGCRQLGLDARLVTGSDSDVVYELRGANSSDVLVGVSMHRNSPRTIAAFEEASRIGAERIAITDHPSCPVANLATTALIVHSSGPQYFKSVVAAVSLVNALLAALAARMFGQRVGTDEGGEILGGG